MRHHSSSEYYKSHAHPLHCPIILLNTPKFLYDLLLYRSHNTDLLNSFLQRSFRATLCVCASVVLELRETRQSCEESRALLLPLEGSSCCEEHSVLLVQLYGYKM